MAGLICDLDVAERPRERILSNGGAALADSELLAILLRTGGAGRSALDVARDLLRERGGLAGLDVSLFLWKLDSDVDLRAIG